MNSRRFALMLCEYIFFKELTVTNVICFTNVREPSNKGFVFWKMPKLANKGNIALFKQESY